MLDKVNNLPKERPLEPTDPIEFDVDYCVRVYEKATNETIYDMRRETKDNALKRYNVSVELLETLDLQDTIGVYIVGYIEGTDTEVYHEFD